MANDKDFLLKNAVEVGGPTKVTLGTVTSNNIDLATGNYFADTPSGTSTYTISNAGDVQSFQLEVTGGTAEVLSNFSTTLYTGNATARTITNGIDLANDGGLVWVKSRSTRNHILSDTERGTGKVLFSNLDIAEDADATTITSYNSDGFTMDSSAFKMNTNGEDFVSWTFKKEPSFFDVVTYTGTGTDASHFQDISHNLGVVPGVVMIKRLNSAENWAVWHRSIPSDMLQLNVTDSSGSAGGRFTSSGVANMTSTTFRVYGDNQTGTSGGTYVAYLFAHDDAADGLIQCGSYTGTGSSQSINLGWEPQWLLIKSTGAADWYILDTQRGWTSVSLTNKMLNPNNSTAESTVGNVVYDIALSSIGFDLASTASQFNAGGQDYIYIAIRAASDPDITWPSSIEWAGGIAPSAPAVGETDVFTLSTDDGGTSYVGVKTADALS